ncbi:two-component sensor histidine kinase [bacterium]|nr:two-component sensor histidine kinase [bacterium]
MSTTVLANETSAERWKEQFTEIATLAGGLAHEIRNPLSTIRLNLELLDEDLRDDTNPQSRRNCQKVQTVLRECGHLEQILNDFLQFARAHALHLERVSLNEEVRRFLDFFSAQAEDSGVDISPHLAAHLPEIDLDPQLFRQLFLNLASNALQSMPQGGRFEVLTYEQPPWVVLELIDTGCGMDERTQQRMFETFFSTKNGGSGLGLPTARRIVQAHGGEIQCESSPGAGTRFRILWPIPATETDLNSAT